MNIILGEENANQISEKYVVLELDTIRMAPDSEAIKAYCLVDNLPINETAELAENKALHEQAIAAYHARDWNRSRELIQNLRGKWNREADSFYDVLLTRLDEFQTNDPGPDWDPVINRFAEV